MKGKIVLITSGQPSLNPRLVKEADVLAEAGYDITVLYAYWNAWGTESDKTLLSQKKWQAIRVGGDPVQEPLTYFFSRLIFKASRFIIEKFNGYRFVAGPVAARSSYFLATAAKKHKAGLYIAHNLGALAAAVKAAKHQHAKCGFDAEDFHRQEVTDDTNSYHFKLAKYVEDKYLPLVDYITASSPLIADQYASLYQKAVPCILNVFPKTNIPAVSIHNEKQPLKLFWFSQTIGSNRGLEIIVEAMGLAQHKPQLHLLGYLADGYKDHLLQLAQSKGATADSIFFYSPVGPEEIFNMAAKFDIGMASEIGFCFNRDIALTNKLFTYIQCGLALAASNTAAQSRFVQQYPETGKVYGGAKELAVIIDGYYQNRELLLKTKQAAYKTGQTELNWENESKKFLTVVAGVIAG